MSIGEAPKYDFRAAAMSAPSKSPIHPDNEIAKHNINTSGTSKLPTAFLSI